MLGWFDVTAQPLGWSDETMQSVGWCDQDLLTTAGESPPAGGTPWRSLMGVGTCWVWVVVQRTVGETIA